MGDYLKCRWCGYRVMKYRTSRDGKVITGWKALARHVEDRHADEHEKLLNEVGVSDSLAEDE